jgi:hypothetical protein
MPLSGRQLRLVEGMAACRTLRAACRALGIPERTARRWRRAPEFQAALAAACRERAREGDAAAVAAYPQAVRTMYTLLRSESELTRLRAAAALMRHKQGVLDGQDLAAKVAVVEARLKELKGAQPEGPG